MARGRPLWPLLALILVMVGAPGARGIGPPRRVPTVSPSKLGRQSRIGPQLPSDKGNGGKGRQSASGAAAAPASSPPPGAALAAGSAGTAAAAGSAEGLPAPIQVTPNAGRARVVVGPTTGEYIIVLKDEEGPSGGAPAAGAAAAALRWAVQCGGGRRGDAAS
jgi:hypothetical protein